MPLIAAPAAENALSQGVSFTGITLAVTGPEGDPVPGQLEQVMSGMRDISQYCTVTAMPYDRALESLRQGRVTAVLVLPEQFVAGVMDGTNPDITLMVPEDRPLESLLTLWVGQSASDMLAAVQAGVYAVLDLYRESPGDGLSYQDAMLQINLRYINWTLNRQEMYRVQPVSATRGLSITDHYSLSVVAFLVMAMAAFFGPVYDARWIRSQGRLRAAGYGWGMGFLCALSACWLVMFLLLGGVLAVLTDGPLGYTLLCSGLCGGFCAVYVSLCCLITDGPGNCGVLSFGLSLILLGLSGGILPPVLMPPSLQPWIEWSPVSRMRNLMAAPEKIPELGADTFTLVALTVLLGAAAAWLYRRRAGKEVALS